MAINTISLEYIKQLATQCEVTIDMTFKSTKIIVSFKKFEGRKIVKTQSFEFTNDKMNDLTLQFLLTRLTEFKMSMF